MSRSSRNRHQHECQYSGCKERQVKVRYENHSTRIRSRYCPDHTCCHFPRCPEGKLSKHELYCAKHGSCGISDCNNRAPDGLCISKTWYCRFHIVICKWHDCSKEAEPRNEFCDDHRDMVEREKLYPDPPVVLPAYVQERIPECVKEYPRTMCRSASSAAAPATVRRGISTAPVMSARRRDARGRRRGTRDAEGSTFCDAHVKEEPETCEAWDIEFVYVFVTAVLLAVAVAFFYMEW
uniref:Uncharacterized protein n=1 Tax=Bionectria ochroleuca TaxID=29856 RepID=A0A8H7NEP4_BIOOC